MSFSFWLLGVESRDFSHAEKERTACRFEGKWLSFCEFAQLCKKFFLSQQALLKIEHKSFNGAFRVLQF